MATDVEMTGVAPIAEDGGLPLPSIVEEWTPEKLFDFAQIQKVLRNEKNRATFQQAEISGETFLERGNDEDFWLRRCGLPIGPSAGLAGLAQTIKNIGKEKSRGNAFHLGSDEPANSFTVQSPPVPWDGVLPTPSDVEQWSRKDVLDYTLIKDILEDLFDPFPFVISAVYIRRVWSCAEVGSTSVTMIPARFHYSSALFTSDVSGLALRSVAVPSRRFPPISILLQRCLHPSCLVLR